MPLPANRRAPSVGAILGFGIGIVGAIASAAVIVMELRRPGVSLLHPSFHVRHIVWVELGVFVIMAQQVSHHVRALHHEENVDVDDLDDTDAEATGDPIALFGPVIAFYDADEADLKDGPADCCDADTDGKKTDRDSSA